MDRWVRTILRAESVQQRYYELLPDWTCWRGDELHLLQRNILTALFGYRTANDEEDEEDTADEENDHAWWNTSNYSKEQLNIMNTIFEKLYEHGFSEDVLKSGIIYNVIFMTEESKREEEEETYPMTAIPIFKIEKLPNQSWYVDTSGRVYKSWVDYKETNQLPKCHMVVPVDGIYQADWNEPVTESYSSVWVEIVKSPACNLGTKAAKAIDICSHVLSIGGTAAAVGAAFTPVGAPIVLGLALVSTVTSSAWTIGRSARQLIDRAKHEETIALNNRESLYQWMGITGGIVGVASTGATMLLTKAVQEGKVIGAAAQLAYDATILSGTVLNSMNLTLQGFEIYSHYDKTKNISTVDAINFAAHLLLFGNSLINIKLAKTVIAQSQGHILADIESNLRSKRFTKTWNRIKRKAAVNNTNVLEENAEIIRHVKQIRTRSDLIPSSSKTGFFKTSSISFKDGKMGINGVTLIDPMEFALRLITSERFRSSPGNRAEASSSQPDQGYNRFMEAAFELLRNLRPGYTPPSYALDSLVRELKGCSNFEEILIVLGKITLRIIKTSSDLEDFLCEIILFLWKYSRENISNFGIRWCSQVENPTVRDILMKFVRALEEGLDMIIGGLLKAFKKYIRMTHFTDERRVR